MSCYPNPLPWCTIIRLSKLAVKIDVSAVNSVSMAPEVGFEPTTKRSEAQGEGGAGQAAGREVRAQPAGRVPGAAAGVRRGYGHKCI
jgi:hypothetical protein